MFVSRTASSTSPAFPFLGIRTKVLYLGFLVAAVAVTAVYASTLPNPPTREFPWVALGIFAAAMLCEFGDSTLGMGYGTILTPALMLFGFSPLQIVPTILISELCTGFSASGGLQLSGVVNMKPGTRGFFVAVILSLCSIVGTVAAIFVAVHISKQFLSLWIAVLIIAMGILILLNTAKPLAFSKTRVIVLGLIASFNKGLSGGGYGPLVTGGQVVAGVEAKNAVAITSFAESFTCLIGIITYLANGKPLYFPLIVPMILGAICAIPLAIVTVKDTHAKHFKKVIGVGVLILGILLLKGIN